LQINNSLIDYNSLSSSSSYPISRFNSEVLFHAAQLPTLVYSGWARVDSNLYNSYASNDLRKTIYFKQFSDSTFYFRGSYDGSVSLFFGLAIDEVYLIRAECEARLGNISEAMTDLNGLMVNRWLTGTFTPFTATNSQDALNIVLTERRKELLMRDSRWMDIKRLNKEGGNIDLTRNLNGLLYHLTANDNNFALPIPEYVISLTGIVQNPR
jgi:starch-binding outer membrane protein, SusD/RagB family